MLKTSLQSIKLNVRLFISKAFSHALVVRTCFSVVHRMDVYGSLTGYCTCAGSDLAGETSAALSAVSMALEDTDPVFAAECLKHAKQLYKFGTQYRGLYNDAIKGAAQYYE